MIIIILIFLIFACIWFRNIDNIEQLDNVSGCTADKISPNNNDSDFPIPKIIHMTCKDKNNMKDLYKNTLASWKLHHPDWDIRIYDDNDLNNFIKDNYSSEIVNKVNSFKRLIFKIDMFKLLVMYKYGGIYTDMDVECLQNLEPLLEGMTESVALGYGPLENNMGRYRGIKLIECAVMIGKPGNKFWIDFFNSIDPNTPDTNPVHVTGPLAITRFIENYTNKSDIKLFDPIHLYPITNTLRRIPKEARAKRDKLLKTKKYDKNTYCVHLFDGSWTR